MCRLKIKRNKLPPHSDKGIKAALEAERKFTREMGGHSFEIVKKRGNAPIGEIDCITGDTVYEFKCIHSQKWCLKKFTRKVNKAYKQLLKIQSLLGEGYEYIIVVEQGNRRYFINIKYLKGF